MTAGSVIVTSRATERAVLYLIHSHLFKHAFEMMQTEAHASFDCPQGYLCALGDFCMGPALKISEFDNMRVFVGDFSSGAANCEPFYQPPAFMHTARNSSVFCQSSS